MCFLKDKGIAYGQAFVGGQPFRMPNQGATNAPNKNDFLNEGI